MRVGGEGITARNKNITQRIHKSLNDIFADHVSILGINNIRGGGGGGGDWGILIAPSLQINATTAEADEPGCIKTTRFKQNIRKIVWK